MARDPEDDIEATRALAQWLEDKPDASIVVAAIDQGQSDELDIALRLSRLTAYHLIGLVQVLVEHVVTIVEETPEPDLQPEYETLLKVKELLDGGARKIQ